MSTTAIPAANAAPKSATTTTNGMAATAPNDADSVGADGTNAGFSDLFSDVLQDAKPDGAVPDALLAQEDKSDTTQQAVSPDGNNLPPYVPFVAWSGTVAVGDDNGASALALQGDNTAVAVGKTVSAADMPTAIQAAVQQPPQAVVNAANPDANAALSKWWNQLENPQAALAPSALSMLVDDKQGLAAGKTENNPLVALASAAATASAASAPNNQALSYVQTARYDQPMGTIPLPVNHPEWGNQLGDGVRWMAQQNLQMADIRLNPPNMGLLEVRIHMNSDQANVTFSSPHAAVRDAIEHAIPRLRDMMGDTGIQLGDVNVSQQSLSQHQSHAEQFAKSSGAGGNTMNDTTDNTALTEIPAVQLPRHGQGLLDLYA